MSCYIGYFSSGAAESRRAELASAAESAAQGAAAARARYDTAQHEAAQARDNAAHAQAQAEQADRRAQTQRQSLQQLKQQLRELESRGNDSLAVYGANMVELVQRVNAAAANGQFSQKPRGPIGAYLKVKEKKWGGALEHIIGGNIQSFCVNTPDDMRKLFQIMEQPGVTCSKFLGRVHDVRGRRVRAGSFVSALDSLDVADPVVANFLIDNIGCESVLLVPDHVEAGELGQQAKAAREQERAAGRALQALLGDRHRADEAARRAGEALAQLQAPQHAVLVEELNISKDKKAGLQRRLDELANKEAENRQKMDEYDNRMKRVKKQLGEVNAACRNTREEIDQEQMKLDRGVMERKTYEKSLRDDENKMTQVKAILEEKHAVIKKKIETAERLCPRMPNPRLEPPIIAVCNEPYQLVQGHMVVDLSKNTLEILCSGREGNNRAASTTSSLSGGERSYSTVAFIMALWECASLPFCFMDEFDVFMDNVNRKVVMEMLIDHALKNTKRQYVFLTPQDISSVTSGPKISIYKMPDPRP
ncbi:hypothetical protein HF086_013141 [Spodoptera exigua]|uniref:RecF/RecN/SMC N-terminal domain-containing protein n=1 Tax=Spodoptera exigua TaxID=7107 RepID=A0A922MB60_SPOEX|nr:hypothetical protein HF086_013141 [Spodoptera exigua]